MDYIFKIKDPLKNYPYVSSRLKVGCDKHYGRFVYSNAVIKAGEVLIIEEPFFYSIDIKNDELNQRCAFCLGVCNSLNSLTCSACKSTVYCSQQCLDESFHESECNLVRKANVDDAYFLLMIRVLVKSINICGSLENLQAFIEKRDKKLTLFDAVDDDFGKLNCCYNLESGNFPQDIKFSKSFVESEKVKKLYRDDKEKFFLVKILLKILGILNRNSFCLEFSDGNSIGAIFPFASLINHSCSPNIERINIGKKTAFLAIRPIDKNEQLFICYRFVTITHNYDK